MVPEFFSLFPQTSIMPSLVNSIKHLQSTLVLKEEGEGEEMGSRNRKGGLMVSTTIISPGPLDQYDSY